MFTVLRPPLVPEMSVENGTWNLAEFHVQAEAQMANEAEVLDWLMAAGPGGLQDVLDMHTSESLRQSLSELGPRGHELAQNASLARGRALRAARKAEHVWHIAVQAINEALPADSNSSVVLPSDLAGCEVCDDDPKPINNQVRSCVR